MKKLWSLFFICSLLAACAGSKGTKVEGIADVPVVKQNIRKADFDKKNKVQSPAEIEKEALLLRILKNPPVPLKSQNKVVRVLFLPYVDQSGVLHSQQYSYVQVEEGKWILGDYLLNSPQSGKRLFKPLDNPAPAGTVSSHDQANAKAPQMGIKHETSVETPVPAAAQN